ncbi:DMT family transporter [uncultured Veillonella sp.]|uniref:DMT family transporter n=1 Tax=uncultured Veillonella sp. TaxID=159268 RepID=UPI0025939968|nr:EamA family transporter [uncultured Veillonella sp.]
MDRNTLIGIALTLLGGILWGFSGICAQFIQQQRGITPEWLLVVRLLSAGAITVFYVFFRMRGTMLRIFKSPKDTAKLLVFGILGMALCQYSYFRSIFYAGAGIATVLQYLAPAMIIIYMSVVHRVKPSWGEGISVLLATVGTALIALHGDFSKLNINEAVLFWGLLSAVAVAIYSVQPVQILRTYGTGPVVGLAMMAGGILAYGAWPLHEVPGTWDMWTFGALFGIVILGTVVSFNAYLEGVRRIGAVRGSVLSSIEPISAALLGWLVLGNTFVTSDMIGFVMILSTIFILANEKKAN